MLSLGARRRRRKRSPTPEVRASMPRAAEEAAALMQMTAAGLWLSAPAVPEDPIKKADDAVVEPSLALAGSGPTAPASSSSGQASLFAHSSFM